MLVDVILPLALDGVLTYNLPDDLIGKNCIGMRVLVPIGNKKIQTGIIYRHSADTQSTLSNIKNIICFLDDVPMVIPPQLKLWEWIASYYMCTLGEVMKAALPSALKLESETCVQRNMDFLAEHPLNKTQDAILDFLADGKVHDISEISKNVGVKMVLPALSVLLNMQAVTISEKVEDKYKAKFETWVVLADNLDVNAVYDSLRLAKSQQKLFAAYLEITNCKPVPIRKRDLLLHAALSSTILKALVDKNIFVEQIVQVDRMPAATVTRDAYSLSVLQQEAYDQILLQWREKSVVLLHGVTSSGKTEIYIKLIQQVIAQNKQVLYLVPEIALTTQLTNRLRAVFGDELGVYHSKFSDAERVEVYKDVLQHKRYKVILGVRSSVLLPFSNLGLVIVDEEHEQSYKQQDSSPRYHARNAALVLAALSSAKTLLGTATPAVETYFNAKQGKYGLVTLSQRYQGWQLPKITLLDLKLQYHRKEIEGHFSDYLRQRITEELNAHKQVMIFQNRRGYASFLTCKNCGYVPKCINCDVSLTVHRFYNTLSCHYCGYTIPIPSVCPSCNTDALNDSGCGTEKVEEECKTLFPDARIARMDLDTTRKKYAYQDIIDSFAQHETDVLIGTQMICKGLHFDDVSLVAVLNADYMINQPNFRSVEYAFQMLAQVAGRAGRKGKQGEVIIQTSNDKHPLFDYLRNYDYVAFYNDQIAERKLFRYPPYFRLIEINIRHRDYNCLEEMANLLQYRLNQAFGGRCSKVITPLVSRVQMQYVRQILLKIENSASISKAKICLQEHIAFVKQQKAGKSTTITINVDPL